MRCLAFLVAIPAGLLAQEPAVRGVPRPPIPVEQQVLPQRPPAAATAPAQIALPALPAALPERPATSPRQAGPDPFADLVLTDVPAAGGPLWALAGGYKASFDRHGFTFYPRQPEAKHHDPLRFTMRAASLAGEPLRFQAADPVLDRRVVQWQRGSLVELVELRSEAVEHSFRFDTLPVRGAIELHLDVATQLRAEATADGIAFRGEQGCVLYREAVAIDGAGRRQALALQWRGGQVVIAVPAEFVATAVLPLLVDPLLHRAVATSGTEPLTFPDIAYDSMHDEYLAVVQRQFTPADQDVYAYKFDAAMQPLGYLPIDVTSDDWRAPRIAYNRIGDCFLVVAQVHSGPGPWFIAGRRVGPTVPGIVGPQFDIERTGVTGIAGDKITPDVGGDACPTAGASYFTVVWSNDAHAGNHGDIYFKQVDASTGLLRSTSPTGLVADNWNSTAPRISKSNGTSADGRWMVAWSDYQISSVNRHDITVAILTWDGFMVNLGVTHLINVDHSLEDDKYPVVSSPALIQGTTEFHFLCVYERANPMPVAQYDLRGAIVSASGTVRTRADLNAVEGGGPFQDWPQWYASVDSDGCRFVVTYHEQYSGTLDYDTHVSTFAWLPASNALVAHESRGPLGITLVDEKWALVAATTGRPATQPMEYGIVQLVASSGSYSLETVRWLGAAPGGYSSPAGFGCGALSIGTSNVPAVGNTISIGVSPAGPLAGFLFGFPGSLSVPACPTCLIGVQGSVTMPNPAVLAIPRNPGLVGATFAVQGWSFGGGPCLGSIALSGVVDITVR